MVKVRITTLCENTAGQSGLLAEHGLSMLIEAGGRRVLLDTGYSATVAHNARALGIDLSEIDAIVLSHGHGDHTGGLKEVLRECHRRGREVPVYAHPEVWRDRYSLRQGEKPRFAGLPHRREELECLGARFELSEEAREIFPGVWLTGEVPRSCPFESLDQVLKVRDGAGWRQDELWDDQALFVRGADGLVVALGCAHSGIVNTLDHIARLAEDRRFLAVVGGTHLGFAGDEQTARTIGALATWPIGRLGVSHCTGLRAAARLAGAFGERFFFNTAGTVLELS